MADETQALKELDMAILYINDAIHSCMRALNSLDEEDQRAPISAVASNLMTRRIELQLCKDNITKNMLV